MNCLKFVDVVSKACNHLCSVNFDGAINYDELSEKAKFRLEANCQFANGSNVDLLLRDTDVNFWWNVTPKVMQSRQLWRSESFALTLDDVTLEKFEERIHSWHYDVNERALTHRTLSGRLLVQAKVDTCSMFLFTPGFHLGVIPYWYQHVTIERNEELQLWKLNKPFTASAKVNKKMRFTDSQMEAIHRVQGYVETFLLSMQKNRVD